MRRDGLIAHKIRLAVRYLLEHGHLVEGGRTGAQSRLAEHFGVSRERISQLVIEERQKLGRR